VLRHQYFIPSTPVIAASTKTITSLTEAIGDSSKSIAFNRAAIAVDT
jgi:hypothetical protein